MGPNFLWIKNFGGAKNLFGTNVFRGLKFISDTKIFWPKKISNQDFFWPLFSDPKFLQTQNFFKVLHSWTILSLVDSYFQNTTNYFSVWILEEYQPLTCQKGRMTSWWGKLLPNHVKRRPSRNIFSPSLQFIITVIQLLFIVVNTVHHVFCLGIKVTNSAGLRSDNAGPRKR